jgi:hypothetical protein
MRKLPLTHHAAVPKAWLHQTACTVALANAGPAGFAQIAMGLLQQRRFQPEGAGL